MPNKIASSGLWAAADLLRLSEPTFGIRPLGNKIYRFSANVTVTKFNVKEYWAQNQLKLTAVTCTLG